MVTSTVTSTVTTGPTMTSTSTGTPPTGGVFLGLPCGADAECGDQGLCLATSGNSAFLGGGPANGYCSKACETDAECPGPSSVCLVGAGGKGECFLGCVPGEPELASLNEPLDPSKCHGREDLRCEEVVGGLPICRPSCGSDAQCEGRFCDPSMGVCVDAPSAGKAMGEKCDPTGMPDECAGVCLQLAGDKTMCSSPCVMGGEVSDPFECGGPEQGVCVYSPAGSGVGDLGYCARACTAQDQCQAPDFSCFDLGLPESGSCLDTTPCTTDMDCNFLDGQCIETSLGKFCMSPKYPLGSL